MRNNTRLVGIKNYSLHAIFFGVFFGLLGWFLINYGFLNTPKPIDLSIEATGNKSSTSKSAEVWFYGAYKISDDKKILASQLVIPPSWEKRDESYVSYANQPSVLKIVNINEPLRLSFGSHPYSGLVRIKWNGNIKWTENEETIDLYSSKIGEKIVIIEPHYTLLYPSIIFAFICLGVVVAIPASPSFGKIICLFFLKFREPKIFIDLPFLLVSIVLLVSIFALNNVITPDSHSYYRFSQELTWDHREMIRTPIYPILLATIDALLGKGGLTFVFLNTLFLILGCYLVCNILLRLGVRQCYRFVAILAFITPVVITYQHTFLTESGLSLILLAIVWVALYKFVSPNRGYLALGLVMMFAYYYKPHFKYFALLIFLLVYVAKDLQFSVRKPQHGWLNSFKPPLIGLIVFASLIYPWDRFVQKHQGMAVLNYFPLAMGVVPADEKYLGEEQLEKYRKAIENPDSIPRNGISSYIVYSIMSVSDKGILKSTLKNNNLLNAAIVENPYGYLKAVFLTLSNYIWSTETGSENRLFFQEVVGVEPELTHTQIYSVSEWKSVTEQHNAIVKQFDSAYSPGILAKMAAIVAPILNVIVAIFMCLLPVAFIRAVANKNIAAFIASGAALGYLAMHGVALLCVDRYAAPTIPLVFLAIVIAFFPLVKMNKKM